MKRGVSTKSVLVKRAYAPASQTDGLRILVDRLWPRGLRKADARIDCWLRNVAPSATLRKWFGHRLDRWKEFKRRYSAELKNERAELHQLQQLSRRRRVTLLFAAHDGEHNNAVALRDILIRGVRMRIDKTGH